MRLPILRHHDNRRLQCGEHVERRAKQQKRIWIESSAQKQPTVHEYPESEKSHECADEFPTAAKLCDPVRGAIGECHTQGFLLIHVARYAMAQELVCPSQPRGQCRKQFQCHPRVAPHEREKIVTSKLRQPCGLNRGRIRRPTLAIEHRHLAEEISRAQLSQRYDCAVSVGNADPHLAHIDQIHRVARVAVAKNRGRLRIIVNGQIFAQLGGRFGIERREERDRT